MFKKFLLTIVVLLFSIGLLSQTVKYINIEQNNWLRIIQYDDNRFTVDKKSYYTTYPSYIITKTTNYTNNGYLHKVWITSNTQLNNVVRNIQINNPNILFWNGNRWVNSFYLEWIIVGNIATQVHYFFYNYPLVQVQMKWTIIKIK